MLQEAMAKESFGPTLTDHEHTEVHTTTDKDGVTLCVYDTRGLPDPLTSDDTILSGIHKNCPQSFDLVLICIKMT